MTNFEKMKYLYRNAGKKAEEKPPAAKKDAKKTSCAEQKIRKGETDEE